MNLIENRLHHRILSEKKQLDSHRPLSEEILNRLHRNLEVEYTYNSNAIEGNTLTLRETQLIIREGITINGKSLSDHLEAKNHPKAIIYIENLAGKKNAAQTLQETDILKIHELIFSGVLENAGNYRNCQVYIEGCDFTPPAASEIPELMQELLAWLRNNPDELRPIELAAVFHHKFVSVHPFDDGNGRVGRLLMNLLLINSGYTLTVIKKVERKKYYDTLQKADNGNLKPLVNFIARNVEQSLDTYLSAIEPSTTENHYMTLAEAAKQTPYSQEYLSLLARQGKIDAVKKGRNWQTTPDALQNYIKRTRSSRKESNR